MTTVRCSALSGDRLALYGGSGACEGLEADSSTVVAVVYTTAGGDTVETLVDASTGAQFVLEDPIMCE